MLSLFWMLLAVIATMEVADSQCQGWVTPANCQGTSLLEEVCLYGISQGASATKPVRSLRRRRLPVLSTPWTISCPTFILRNRTLLTLFLTFCPVSTLAQELESVGNTTDYSLLAMFILGLSMSHILHSLFTTLTLRDRINYSLSGTSSTVYPHTQPQAGDSHTFQQPGL